MLHPPPELEKWLQNHLFDAIPMAIAVIDRQFDLVFANMAFERMFGAWQGRKCYETYKSQKSKCPQCHGRVAFSEGRSAINEEVGYNKDGLFTRYIKHTIPVINKKGEVPYLVEMCVDITETEQIRREYQLLFDQVPCSVLIIDRNYRIVKTNEQARKLLGNLDGKHCYRGLKRLDSKCRECTARQTFSDGKLHTGHHEWQTKQGETVHAHVVTVPLRVNDGAFDMVMELAVDITKTVRLQDGLAFAHSFLETIISTSMDGIFAVDMDGNVNMSNPAARQFFAIRPDEPLSKKELESFLPPGFLEKAITGSRHINVPETTLVDAAGCQRPVRLVGHPLSINKKPIGAAFSIQDLSELKRLEEEKLKAERLAAVGQTVAGLAHGVKNLTTALEGGMYMLSSGIERGDLERIQKGMTMLDRNTGRISRSVKAFLNFAKGREIRVQLSDPGAVVKEVADMYATKAEALGIQLTLDLDGPIEPAFIDYESIHECLTNLVGNAIDACQTSNNRDTHVILRAWESARTIFYEVIDNGCGMEYSVRKKVFTTIFTTKGLDGTGIGLLTTKKIIQEHGGTIRLQSRPDKGTTFRISLNRDRLPQPQGSDRTTHSNDLSEIAQSPSQD